MTGVISMLVVVIKNKQMEYIKQNETKIEQNQTNQRIKFD